MVLFKANASTWPTDPKQLLTLWEGVIAGGDQLLKAGTVKEVGWFTNLEGYGVFEADSKAKVLASVNAFFPYYTQEIHEIVPWDEAKTALLSSARMAAAPR